MARWQVLERSGGETVKADPDPGGHVHVTTGPSVPIPGGGGKMWHRPCSIGALRSIEFGESFSAGAALATDGAGRAVQAQSGAVIVATALMSTADAPGDSVYVVMRNQAEVT